MSRDKAAYIVHDLCMSIEATEIESKLGTQKIETNGESVLRLLNFR